MIKIDDYNYLNYVNAPWDGNPLNKSANSITQFRAEDEITASKLLLQFEKECSNINYTSVRQDSNNLHLNKSLSKAGYSQTEVVLKVTGILSKITIDNSMFNKFSLCEANEQDFIDVKKYAIKYFNHGKFHEDPLIPRISADIRNSNMVEELTSLYTTFVGKVENKIIGFMILNQDGNVVKLLLGGMHPDYRYLSYSFWGKIFEKYKNEGIKKITTTISATNIPVVNLYSHFGFKFTQALHGYRKFR